MEVADVARLVGAGVAMLVAVGAALIVGIVRADRDERRRWADDLDLDARMVNLWEEARRYLERRPLPPEPELCRRRLTTLPCKLEHGHAGACEVDLPRDPDPTREIRLPRYVGHVSPHIRHHRRYDP